MKKNIASKKKKEKGREEKEEEKYDGEREKQAMQVRMVMLLKRSN